MRRTWLRRVLGALLARVDAELAHRERVDEQLRKGATYEQARAAVGADLGDLTPARWRFIGRNFTVDATAAVAAPRSVYVDGYLDDLRRYLESTAPTGVHR
ncbi:hypothetical protein [Kitasatospora sp. NPDC056181]|uniref:hypothetical protein n=1 Tax=Kitasatospora sp. NPDC056181 TaxID=3345737 RepID=UPI0035D533EB